MSFTPFRFLRPELRRRGSTAEGGGGEEGTINVARSKVREKEREKGEERKEQTK